MYRLPWQPPRARSCCLVWWRPVLKCCNIETHRHSGGMTSRSRSRSSRLGLSWFTWLLLSCFLSHRWPSTSSLPLRKVYFLIVLCPCGVCWKHPPGELLSREEASVIDSSDGEKRSGSAAPACRRQALESTLHKLAVCPFSWLSTYCVCVWVAEWR